MARVAVPLVGVRLSPPLAVIALVSSYLTNKLIARRPIIHRKTEVNLYPCGNHQELVRLSTNYACVNGMYLRVTTPFAGS